MTRSRRFIAIPCVFMTLFVFGAVAEAEEVTIYACVQKNSGDLRIVSGVDDCRNSEIAIWWNQTGPAGQPGPQGPPGESGNQDVRMLADLLGQPTLILRKCLG